MGRGALVLLKHLHKLAPLLLLSPSPSPGCLPLALESHYRTHPCDGTCRRVNVTLLSGCCVTRASVQDAMAEEPLDLGRVVISDTVADKIRQALHQLPKERASLMKDIGDVCVLVQQVLSFDLRSLHRRQHDIRETYQLCVAGLMVEYVVADGHVRVTGVSVVTK